MRQTLFFLALFSLHFLIAQTKNTSNDGVKIFVNGGIDGNGDLTSILFKQPTSVTVGDIYLYKEWVNDAEIVSSTDKKFEINGLNYNINKDNFEIKISEDSIFTINNKSISQIKIEKSVFQRFDEIDNADGFYEIFFLGQNIAVLKKYSSRLIHGKLNPLDGSKEANRYYTFSKYYIKKNDSITKINLKKRTILYLFNEKKKIVNEFIKNNHLSTKKEGDLLKILEYADSI